MKPVNSANIAAGAAVLEAPGVPQARTADSDGEGGRGLELVEALSARWGSGGTAAGP
jgi:hypothetical protein